MLEEGAAEAVLSAVLSLLLLSALLCALLQVHLAPDLCDSVFQAMKVALGGLSRIERIKVNGTTLVL
jgi:hypothetical protein